MARTTREQSDAHEKFLAGLFNARQMPGSGNQFNGQADVRNDDRRQWHAYAVDGKATFGKSISVTRAMIEKIIEQAHNERPALAFRFYLDETMRDTVDWVAVSADDFFELLMDARSYREHLRGPKNRQFFQ